MKQIEVKLQISNRAELRSDRFAAVPAELLLSRTSDVRSAAIPSSRVWDPGSSASSILSGPIWDPVVSGRRHGQISRSVRMNCGDPTLNDYKAPAKTLAMVTFYDVIDYNDVYISFHEYTD